VRETFVSCLAARSNETLKAQQGTPVVGDLSPDHRLAATDISQRRFVCVLLAILALAGGLRFYQLGADDYWLDELHSLANSAGKRAQFESFKYGEVFVEDGSSTALDANSTAGAVWRTMRADSHPPFYFLLLLYWRRLFGDGEFALRSLSAALSVVSLIPPVIMLRNDGERRAGLLAALVLSLASASVFMAQQNRQYSLGLLMLGCSFVALQVLQNRANASTPARLAAGFAYAATLFASMMSHYFCGLALVGHVVYAVLCFRSRLLRDWALSLAAATALFVVTWGPTVLAQLDFIRDQPWVDEAGPGHLVKSFLRLMDLPIRLLLMVEPFRSSWWRSALGAAVFAGIVAFCARKSQRTSWMFLLWFAAPALALLLLDLSTQKQLLNHVRYPVIGVPGLAGLLGLGLSALTRRAQILASVGLVLVTCSFIRFPATRNPESRAAVAALEEAAGPGDILVFDAIDWPRDWVPQFYAPMRYYMREGGNPRVLLREQPTNDVREAIGSFDRIVVVSPRIEEEPNPSPGTHRRISKSRYNWQVGWIYVFEKTAGG
jgi:uncharacterized membrane protein